MSPSFTIRIRQLEDARRHLGREREELARIKKRLVQALNPEPSSDIVRINLRESLESVERRVAENSEAITSLTQDITLLLWDIKLDENCSKDDKCDSRDACDSGDGDPRGGDPGDDSCDASCNSESSASFTGSPPSPLDSAAGRAAWLRKHAKNRAKGDMVGKNASYGEGGTESRSDRCDEARGKCDQAKGYGTPEQHRAMQLHSMMMTILGSVTGKDVSFSKTSIYIEGKVAGVRYVIDAKDKPTA